MSELPGGWRRTTLGDECEIVSGSTPKTSEPAFWDGDIPWLTPADLSKWKGTYIEGGARYITQAGLDSCSARLFPKNTVMMSSRAPIGYTAIASREICTNQGFKSMLPSPSVHPEWLRYFLEHALSEIKAMSSGTTFAEISGKKLGTLPMNLPPIEEQKNIVETLDDHLTRLDKALAELEHADSQTQVLRRSILNELLTSQVSDSEPGAKRVSELPEGWVQEPLVKHIMSKSGDSKIIKGKQSPKPQAGLFQGFSASGADVWVPEAHYQGKGIVVSAVGARCGKTFQAEGQWTAIANTHVLVPSIDCGVDFKWLWYLTNDEDFWIRSGTAQPFVKVKDTLLRPQLIPPLDVQKRIVETLDDHLARLDSTRTSIASQRGSIQTLRRSLLNKAFNGELGTD